MEIDFNDWIVDNAYQDSPCIIVGSLPRQVLAFTEPFFDESSVGVYVPVQQVNQRNELIRDMLLLSEDYCSKHGAPSGLDLVEKRFWRDDHIKTRMKKLGIGVEQR